MLLPQYSNPWWQFIIDRLKNDISGGPKLKSITNYHLGFVIKFLWKIL